MYTNLNLKNWNEEVKKKAFELNSAHDAKQVKEKKLPLSHIFDENLSIKENRRLIEAHNEVAQERNTQRGKYLGNLKSELHSLMVAQLVKENPEFNEHQVAYVFSEVRDEENVCDWHFYATLKLEYIGEVIELGKKKSTLKK